MDKQMQRRANRCPTGGRGPPKRRCVCVCVCQQGSRGPGCLNPLTATCHSPLRPSGPFPLSYLHTHTHTRALHQWELVVTVVMAGVGRATDASFSTFVSLHAFHLPTSLHLSLSPSIHPFSVVSLPLSSIPSILRLCHVWASWHLALFTSPHSYPHTHTLSHMLELTSTAALEQGCSFYSGALTGS